MLILILLTKNYILHFWKKFFTPQGMIHRGISFFKPKIWITKQNRNQNLKCLTHWSVAQAGANDEKIGSQKSRWTVPSSLVKLRWKFPFWLTMTMHTDLWTKPCPWRCLRARRMSRVTGAISCFRSGQYWPYCNENYFQIFKNLFKIFWVKGASQIAQHTPHAELDTHNIFRAIASQTER